LGYVDFTGVFPTDINANKLVLNSTSESGNPAYGVTNAYVTSASGTTISVGVYIWHSSDLTQENGTAWVTVYVGR
jgi:hypothetical protein